MKGLLLVCAFFGASMAQNCGIVGNSGDVVNIAAVVETTPVDTLVWQESTFNVTSAAAIQHPHVQYLSGLRYSTRYEYRATAVFPEFVQAERTELLVRNVLFTCSDGSTKQYRFVLPVLDENTEPPKFAEKQYNATVSHSNISSEPHSANIRVTDADFSYRNAMQVIRSSNALLTPFVDPLWTEDNPSPFEYKIDFFVSKSLPVGEYNIVITSDNGKFSDSTELALTVTE